MGGRRRFALLLAGAVLGAPLGACHEEGPTLPATAVTTSVGGPDLVVVTGQPAPSAGATTTRATATTASTTATAPVTTTTDPWALKTPLEACLGRAEFGDPGVSPYRLPFAVGTGYTVMQTYCTDDGSHEDQLAYDFFMPIGTEVLAARDGVARDVREDIGDVDQTSLLNYVWVEHADGTAAFYAHLTRDGALVAPGEEVAAGQVIALSGASGRTHPDGVLHFGVYRTWPPRDEADVAVNFSNAEGALDSRGGLRLGTFYRALP